MLVIKIQAGQKAFAGAFTQILQTGCYVGNGSLMLIFLEKLMPNHHLILSKSCEALERALQIYRLGRSCIAF